MARRNRVTGEAPPPPPESSVRRCQSCGVGLHGSARRQYICSWCKEDPDHGTDGYFNDIIDDLMARVCPPEMTRAQVRDMLLADRGFHGDPVRDRGGAADTHVVQAVL